MSTHEEASTGYLCDVPSQLVVLLHVEACPLQPLVEEEQVLPVSGVGIDVLLRERERERERKTGCERESNDGNGNVRPIKWPSKHLFNIEEFEAFADG